MFICISRHPLVVARSKYSERQDIAQKTGCMLAAFNALIAKKLYVPAALLPKNLF